MNRTKKPLQLKTETLRALSNGELRAAAGGGVVLGPINIVQPPTLVKGCNGGGQTYATICCASYPYCA